MSSVFLVVRLCVFAALDLSAVGFAVLGLARGGFGGVLAAGPLGVACVLFLVLYLLRNVAAAGGRVLSYISVQRMRARYRLQRGGGTWGDA